MDNREIRKLNLRYAIRYFGSVDALAEKAECSKKYLEQILQGFQSGKDKNPRKLGDIVSGKIAQALNHQPYWMDQPHPELWEEIEENALKNYPIQIKNKNSLTQQQELRESIINWPFSISYEQYLKIDEPQRKSLDAKIELAQDQIARVDSDIKAAYEQQQKKKRAALKN